MKGFYVRTWQFWAPSLGRPKGGHVKPILFNTEMVRAILDGHKTVTRRPVKKRYSNTDRNSVRLNTCSVCYYLYIWAG